MRKKILITLVAVVILVVGALALLVANLGSVLNRNKGFILSRAEATVGRPVTIGDIGVSLRGGIGVRLSNVALADDPDFSSEPFVEARELQVNAKLLPLLRKKFEIKRVILRSPTIRVVRDASGRMNFDSLRPDAAPREASQDPEPQQAPAALAIGLATIEDGTLHFRDARQDLQLSLTRIESRVENVDLDHPIPIELEGALLSEERNLWLGGTFGPLSPEDGSGEVPFDARITIDPINVDALVAALPQAKAALPEPLLIDGPVSLAAQSSGVATKFAAALDLDASATSLQFADRFRKTPGVPLTIGAQLEVSPAAVDIRETKLVFHTLEAQGTGDLSLGDTPSLRLDLHTNRAALAGWNETIPTLEPYALSGAVEIEAHVSGPLGGKTPPQLTASAKVSDAGATVPQLMKPITNLRADVSLDDEQIVLSGASLSIGESRASGRATVRRTVPPSLEFEAKAPVIALDDFRPPPEEQRAPDVLQDVALSGSATLGETVTSTGTVASPSGSLGGFGYQELKGRYRLAGTEARFSDVDVKTLNGTITGDGVVHLSDPPSFEFTTKARGVDVVQAMDKIPSVTRKYLRGRANLDLTVSGTGKEWTAIEPTISGNGLAELFEGAIVDVNILNNIITRLAESAGLQNAISQGLKEKYPKVFQAHDTAFRDLKSSFVIENGKLLTRNLALDAGDFSMNGKGAVDFRRGLDMNVTLRLSKSLTADLIKEFELAKYLSNPNGQIEVPFTLAGILPKVDAKPDPSFLDDVIKKAAASEAEKFFGKQLKDLFGRDKK